MSHTLRELDPVDRREIMRIYGVHFRNSGATRPDGVNVPTPASVPAESAPEPVTAPVTLNGFQSLEPVAPVSGNGVVTG